jgi:hypothetical protein
MASATEDSMYIYGGIEFGALYNEAVRFYNEAVWFS